MAPSISEPAAGGGGAAAGLGALASIDDFSSKPARWRETRGSDGTDATTHAYAAAGLDLRTRDSDDHWTGILDGSVGLVTLHDSDDYVALAEFDNLTNLGEVGAGQEFKIALTHFEGSGDYAHGTLGEAVAYLDGNAVKQWELYKVRRLAGDTALEWSPESQVESYANVVGIRLQLSFTAGSGFEAYYSVDTGGGYGALVELGGAPIATGDVEVQTIDGAAAESAHAYGPRCFAVRIAQNFTSAADMGCRLSAFTVT